MTVNKVAEVSAQYLAELDVNAVPVGYKQTEVGVIPENWEVCELGETVTFQRGFDLPHRLRINGDIPIISSSGESGCHNKAMVKAPGIVTGRYGTIGEIFYIKKDFWPLNTTLYVREFKKLSPEYALHFLRTVDFESHSGKSGVPGVNRNDIHQEKVAVPSVEEQTAIANALSDVDALISELEKLIAKKQAIKTATMQQLLTGRTRLPQFALREDGSKKGYKQSELGEIPEDWEVRCLGDFAVYLGSGKTNTKSIGDYPLYGSTGLIGSCKSPEYDGEAILVARVGANAGRLNFVSGAYGVSDNTIIIKLNASSDVQFFRYWLIRKNLNTLVFGSGQPLITGSQLKALLLSLPSREEQIAISTILSDMDSEIQALQQRLAKTRQIKQGMMQELLTGKTRLIQPAGSTN